VTENLIQGHFSGVRPLQDEKDESASKVTRDYFIDVNRDQAPYLSIFGGKITTHRALAEKVLHSLSDIFPQHQMDWTAHAKLPGGEFLSENRLLEIEKLKNQYVWLNPTLIEQYFARYGTLTHKLLLGARKMQDMGIPFSDALYEREVRYLVEQEWAQTAEDILWRRTKLGYHFSAEQTEALKLWLLKEF
jgi:glycerol-3-phosphate dehydrogenase